MIPIRSRIKLQISSASSVFHYVQRSRRRQVQSANQSSVGRPRCSEDLEGRQTGTAGFILEQDFACAELLAYGEGELVERCLGEGREALVEGKD